MRGRRITDAAGALAGVVLVVLVFLPWWAFDPAADPGPSLRQAGAVGYLNLYAAPDASAWDGLRSGALIWIATGMLGAALALAPHLGLAGPALRGMRVATLGAALISLAIALVRLADPPLAGYQPAAAGYAGTVAIAVLAIVVAAGLRGADDADVRGRPLGERLIGVAGVALVALVFLPWWEFDAGRLDRAGSGWTAYVVDPLQFGPWHGFRTGAVLWTATGLLCLALAVTVRAGAGGRTVRRLRRGVVGAAVVSLIAVIARIAEPPGDFFSPAAPAFAGAALLAVIAISAAICLRRA